MGARHGVLWSSQQLSLGAPDRANGAVHLSVEKVVASATFHLAQLPHRATRSIRLHRRLLDMRADALQLLNRLALVRGSGKPGARKRRPSQEVLPPPTVHGTGPRPGVGAFKNALPPGLRADRRGGNTAEHVESRGLVPIGHRALAAYCCALFRPAVRIRLRFWACVRIPSASSTERASPGIPPGWPALLFRVGAPDSSPDEDRSRPLRGAEWVVEAGQQGRLQAGGRRCLGLASAPESVIQWGLSGTVVDRTNRLIVDRNLIRPSVATLAPFALRLAELLHPGDGVQMDPRAAAVCWVSGAPLPAVREALQRTESVLHHWKRRIRVARVRSKDADDCRLLAVVSHPLVGATGSDGTLYVELR